MLGGELRSKLLSSALAAALVAVSPGSGLYQAFGQVAGLRGAPARGMSVVPFAAPAVQGLNVPGLDPTPGAWDVPSAGGALRFGLDLDIGLQQELSAPRTALKTEVAEVLDSKTAGVSKVLERVGPVAKAGAQDARVAGRDIQVLLEGRKAAEDGVLALAPQATLEGVVRGEAAGLKTAPVRALSPNKFINGPSGAARFARYVVGIVASVLRMGVGAGALWAVSAASALAVPALFAAVPAATVWAGGVVAVVALPALYARYRLSRLDNADYPRARGPKYLIDVALGAAAATLWAAWPLLDAGAFGALSTALTSGAAFAAIDAGALLGISAAAVLASAALFLPQITGAIKSGEPYRAPVKFMPAFYWLMAGAVAALVGGFTGSGLYVNVGIGLWMFMRESRLFRAAYAGLGAYLLGSAFALPAVATLGLAGLGLSFAAIQFLRTRKIGFYPLLTLALGLGAFLSAPLAGSFGPLGLLFVAFTPGLAMSAFHDGLAKFLPFGPASFDRAPERTDWVAKGVDALNALPRSLAARFPNAFLWAKTALAFALMGALATAAIGFIFPFMTFLKSLGIAAAMAGLSFWFSHKLVIKMMQGVPISKDPGIQRRVMPMLERIAKKKGVPVPDTYIIPTMLPNAFATGRSPKHAVVGVTVGILGMLTDEELEGVLAHEMSHITHRDMLMNAVLGALASGISFSAYGVMWAVSTARDALFAVFGGLRGKRGSDSGDRMVNVDRLGLPAADQRQMAEPVTIGAALTSLPALFKIMAALNAPLLGQLLTMFSSRTRESHADVGAYEITGKAEPLATALLKLQGWRPTAMFLAEPVVETPGPNATLRERIRAWWRNRLAVFRKGAAEAGVFAHGAQFTVNPGTQVTPEAMYGPLTRSVLGDDFLFNLFVTHPPVRQRVNDLRALERAQGDKK